MINSCVGCGEKVKGVMKLCGTCQREADSAKKADQEGRPTQASAWSCP